MKPLNSGHLVVLNNLSVIERCQLLGGNIKKIVIFGTQHFVCYSLHVRYWEISLYQKNVGRYERNHWKQESPKPVFPILSQEKQKYATKKKLRKHLIVDLLISVPP